MPLKLVLVKKKSLKFFILELFLAPSARPNSTQLLFDAWLLSISRSSRLLLLAYFPSKSFMARFSYDCDFKKPSPQQSNPSAQINVGENKGDKNNKLILYLETNNMIEWRKKNLHSCSKVLIFVGKTLFLSEDNLVKTSCKFVVRFCHRRPVKKGVCH